MRISLAHLDTGFSLTVGGRDAFRLPPDQALAARLATFWPPTICEGLSPFDVERDGYRAHGVAGSPATAQGRGHRILLYVNGRPVQDKMMLSAVRQAYRGMLLSREYPQLVLFLEIPPDEVDVNVHPAKLEVRFLEESRVFSVIRAGIMDAISDPNNMDYASSASSFSSVHEGSPIATPSGVSAPVNRSHTPSGHGSNSNFSSYREYQSDYNPPTDIPLPVPPPVAHGGGGLVEPVQEPVAMSYPTPDATQNAPLSGTDFTYLGQVADTYLVLKQGDSLVLIDQHAAHERVLLAAMREERTKGDFQPLALPVEIPLHPSEAEILQGLWEDLKSMGFQLEMDGMGKVLMRGIPPTLDSGKARGYLTDALAEKVRTLDDLWIMMSCKTAIKANQPLATDEALALLDIWLKTPEKEFCPHGRPIVVKWNPLDLEKLFKRK